ncbi:UvrD-helicase domain-containing protein [Pseudomonas aeruginosa]|uniref:UvrD-helicase domain-containing protein n=1 Tax=Pseudomonas aeruginosa TaxID=287 RepID=UPI0011B6BCAD|nr:UvrD-helicase domain-containing protein [Pseudomonas aeruginosa]MCV0133343.1 UvrD-helicase domain-containing protein [Pseudomonas aeruginosa]TWW52337.1 AAA family ATPase [Pseudomonas aeruginosa]HCF2284636.1 UvrD-helicase domain-containing protein [Pseudomonas aeruginosa]
MTVPTITEVDLEALATLAPDLNFEDEERRAVLLENQCRDINAAPGSGKTTVLAAKLLLLSQKWEADRCGVCVLSHTNVARDEIQRRLGESVDGGRLLAYPHFIGTIHAFVNHFLALPYLRSKGGEVDVIDNDVFSRRALALAQANWSLRTYMQKNPGVAPMVEGLIYKGANLDIASENGALPKQGAKTRPMIEDIKSKLTVAGVFRHADMFAFAEQLLVVSPQIRAQISRRFPLVFIDEMQDTSWEQERLLQLIFDESVIIQRFGDINQRILGSSEGAENLTFPRADALPISTSKRFGPSIAQVVARTQLSGVPVTGDGLDRHAPMLMVYSTARVDQVIAAFGAAVLERFDETALRTGPVKALCARKQGDAAKSTAGRTLLDYWPASAAANASGLRLERFWSLLTGSARAGDKSLSARVDEVRRALFLVLRSAKADVVQGLTTDYQLLRKLRDADGDIASFRLLLRDLSLDRVSASTEDGRRAIVAMLFNRLRPLLPADVTMDSFTALPIFAEPFVPPASAEQRTLCTVEHQGRRLGIQVGSLASMKGETHLATLVLESLGHPSRRFDVQEALPVIARLSERSGKLSEGLLSQFRNLYVGTSRPTSFLCLAVNAERVAEECKAALLAQGWDITHLT